MTHHPLALTFDRGTLVLPPSPTISDERLAHCMAWDDRVGLWRAPAYRYASIVAGLKGAIADRVMDASEPCYRWQPSKLRPYQDAALLAWHAGGRRGIICLPTGAGKTHVAIAAMASLRVPTLCLVPTRALLEQWHKALSEAYTGEVGILGDGQRTLRPVTVATFESAYRGAWWLGNRYSFVIVDEVHHFGYGQRDEALQMLAAPFRLGLSATLPEDGPQAAGLRDLVGPKVFERAIGDLAGGYLADHEICRIMVTLSDEERQQYTADYEVFRFFHRQFRLQRPAADWREFLAYAQSQPEGRRAVAAHRRARSLLSFALGKQVTLQQLLQRHEDRKTLIFTADTASALAVARRFLVMPIIAEIGRSEREAVLQAFRDGRLRHLVACKVLNEGIDVPDAEVAIVLGGSGNRREHVQRIGRLLRPSPGKKAMIYEIVAADTLEVNHALRRGVDFESKRSVSHA